MCAPPARRWGARGNAAIPNSNQMLELPDRALNGIRNAFKTFTLQPKRRPGLDQCCRGRSLRLLTVSVGGRLPHDQRTGGGQGRDM